MVNSVLDKRTRFARSTNNTKINKNVLIKKPNNHHIYVLYDPVNVIRKRSISRNRLHSCKSSLAIYNNYLSTIIPKQLYKCLYLYTRRYY